MPANIRSVNKFARFAWGLLAYNILVILWGAYVRASRSGDGCGNHWPNCNGQIIPVNGAQANGAQTKYLKRLRHGRTERTPCGSQRKCL